MESIEIIDNLRVENEKLHNQLMETEKDAQDKIAELESKITELYKMRQSWVDSALEWKQKYEELKSKENICEHEEIPFADEQYEEDLLAELQDRHQQDCIEINRLNTVIEVLIDKHSRLRQQIGL